ncbi:competence type IV pilus assembly protein ComGB [Streptococcus oricebi]|uniref:Competence protein CglB n=1 Tax=Streptococcus oricebi TaxID=1547447 RepID=A0ABS5B481_9STRE|nr:competence type IV pilus assembly protein ComGB [Streptococcus oricebi]MBP2623610.1 competence protein CglB [Streptococcus oricebi]
MSKLLSFLQQDISVLNRQKVKRLSTNKQKKIIELFSNLFSSGFHLAETVHFFQRSALIEKAYVDRMREGLSAGQSFASMMANLGFADHVVTQLSLAEAHGNIKLSLLKISSYLENLAKVKKKLIEVATYPLILLLFLLLIMLGLRHYLLPQLDSKNLASQLISNLPQIFLLTSLGLLFFALLALFYYRKSSKLAFFSRLAKLPFLGAFTRSYLTAYYAREWGNMIGQGLELSQILVLMQDQASALFRELGQDLTYKLQNGQEFSQAVAQYPFFKRELSLIIEYGEVKSKLGSELEVYASKTWEEFFSRLHATMNLIQPLVFIFVALMIVLLYAAMLLPLYQNMEVHL